MPRTLFTPRISLLFICWPAWLVGTAACHRDPQTLPPIGVAASSPPSVIGAVAASSPSAVTSSVAASAAKPSEPLTSLKRHEAKGRIVAIGDLHGDLAAAKRAMQIAKVVDGDDRWIGGNSTIVQTGDLLDRGNEERPLLEWLERLATIADAGGGVLYRLNGNHEVMNVAGDLRYVTDTGFTAFAEYGAGSVPSPLQEVPTAQRGRLMAFLPGGPWARRLAQYPVVMIVNDTLFTHGGLLPKHVEYGLERINAEVSSWMRGSGKLGAFVGGDESPFWNRTYGENVSDADCSRLSEVLKMLAVKRLVVGHTPQKSGISFACDRQVARIDVGMSSFYGKNPASVLEIVGDKVTVLSERDEGARKAKPQRTQEIEARP